MNPHCVNKPGRCGRQKDAMSLIELIGVLAVVAVLAGIALPSAIRILDRIAAEREVAVLSDLGDSFRSSILRSRQIRSPSDWVSVLATEAGMEPIAVTQNPRRVQRAYLYDKGGWLGSVSFPYYQTNNPPGLAAVPANARVMLVSSLGKPLPTTLNNTDMTGAHFSDLWNAAENSVPTTGPWVGWGGQPDDVKIQRVNLAPLFVNVVLSTYTGTNLGLYRIDNSGFYSATNGAGVARYYLKGTVLQLYASAPTVTQQHSEVLDHDTSFVYENGVWRSSILGGTATALGNASGIVEAFLKAPENINALHTNGAGIQQYIIVTNFIAYMSNYNLWEDQGFPSKNGMQTHLQAIQVQMMDAVEGIFKFSDNHYPTNNYVPCGP